MKTLVLLLALTLPGVAFAQQGRRHDGKPQQMRQEDRQRMREDMNQVYRERGRDARPERQGRPMSQQERDKLRQDVRDANKQMKR
jgi:hypothetical protein